MAKYAHVVDGAIRGEYSSIPLSFGNTSNFNYLSDEERKTFGFYITVEAAEPIVNEFQRTVRSLTFENDIVSESYSIVEDPVEEIRDTLWNRIKNKRQAIVEGGVLVGTKWYHSDIFSRTQWLGMIIQGASLPAGIMWKTMDNSFIELTPILIQQVFTAILIKEQQTFLRAEVLKNEVYNSLNPAEIDLDTGWPAFYS